MDASVESIGATASGQEIPMVEFEESEPNSPSLSSEDDDYSKLEGDQNDKFSGTSSGSGSPFEEVVVTSEMPSMATEEAKVNDEQSDNINGDDLTPVSSFVSEDVLTSRSNEGEPNLASSNDDNHNDKYVKVSSEDITKEDLTPKGSGSLQGIQPEISVPSPSAEGSLIEDVNDELDKTNKGDSTLKSSNSTKSSSCLL